MFSNNWKKVAKERLDYIEAIDFSKNLSDTEVKEIYNLIGVHIPNGSIDEKREALKYIKFHKLQSEPVSIPVRDLRFESICAKYRK